jgi:hypothetical protein
MLVTMSHEAISQVPSQRKSDQADQSDGFRKLKRGGQRIVWRGGDFSKRSEIVTEAFTIYPRCEVSRGRGKQPFGHGRTAQGAADVDPGKNVLELFWRTRIQHGKFHIRPAFAK